MTITAEAVAAGAGANQVRVARQARCAYDLRPEAGADDGAVGAADGAAAPEVVEVVAGAPGRFRADPEGWEGSAAGDGEETDEAEEDTGEGSLSGTSGGVVVDEADGMNTPQTVGGGRLTVR
ncbi:hypothetical protein [Actinomyces viscosus]|uniref:hypothetical protein n=1 Tax=Actinomyces viscosus TaxID=1656 RepID=UPI0028E65818|nr:hypothetical protein [Actinomyces viscosus]